MKEAIKSIMQKESMIMRMVNSNSDNNTIEFEAFANGLSKQEIIVLECLMHIGRDSYSKLSLPSYNNAEELINTYYNDIVVKEQKEFKKIIAIDRMLEKFLRLHDYFEYGFKIINDPYVSRNLVEI